jgi:DNA-directed RNA polymerase subunit M/transcription elongation factor TFIIS
MKCYACGYEKSSFYQDVEKVIKYQSGKRKGEIKGTETIRIEPDKDKEDFKIIEIEKGFDFVKLSNYNEQDKVRIFACPICGTLKING